MRQFVRGHWKLSAVLLFAAAFAVCWVWLNTARVRGRLAARYDLSRGRYELLALGLPAQWRPEYARLLGERYGIELRVVAGCMVTEPLMEYVSGYDAIVAEATSRRFGHDVLMDAAKEASRSWVARNPH